ncbi:spore cortex-lytic enzyme precursor [Oxobacter pfennigii]|uniref:Spore cortex-lytic enzyme n=1 Tax=Oxobacter pfennigii TaxID=36849 RepID=A0A0P8W9C9_9CLOT|nr:spore cortex-lytic enzyme precursor [Oxobacter pfennigii]
MRKILLLFMAVICLVFISDIINPFVLKSVFSFMGNSKTSGILPAAAKDAAQKNNSNEKSSNKDVSLMARAINGEARGEPYIGAVAVGAVIMNRTRDPRFPDTVPGVIYQPGAFTAITDGQINAKMEPQAEKAARDALNGWDPSGGAIYYYNPAKTTNKWIWSRQVIKTIGKHKFCK